MFNDVVSKLIVSVTIIAGIYHIRGVFSPRLNRFITTVTSESLGLRDNRSVDLPLVDQ